ncbi:MAG: hypothetical protein ACRC47_07430 [Shewanella sp.]
MKKTIEVQYKSSHALQIGTKEYYQLRLISEATNRTMAEVLRELIGKESAANKLPEVVVIGQPKRGRPITPVIDLESIK